MAQERCPKCQAPVESGSQFCGNCGQRIPSPSAAPVAQTLFMASGAAVRQQIEARLAQRDQLKQGHPQTGPQSKSALEHQGNVPAHQTPVPAPQAPSPAPQAPVPAPQAPSPAPQAPISAPQSSSPAPQAARGASQIPEQAAPQPARQPDRNNDSAPAAGPMAKLRATGSLVGMTLNNRYEVLARIGEGGFGTIYLARQIQMDRQVALKVLNPYMSDDPKLVERFRREARAACNLKDPHTIITYDFDQTDDGVLYLAMEYLRGRTLFELLEQQGGLSVDRTIDILSQCCSSLAEAHQAGIVHRDIKPENIFLEDRPGHPDYVKILDFGIAKIVSGDAAQSPALTAAGQTLGTLEYMSPEQLTGKPLDGRSDIYALGILAYEMLTGTLPFQSNNPATIISGHLREQPHPPSAAAPEAGISEELDRIVLKMLAKNREQRYPDAASLKKDLDALIRSSGGPDVRRKTPRGKIIFIVSAVAATLAMATALGLYLAGVL